MAVPGAEQLHISRFYADKRQLGAPVLLLHSVAQDSRVFTGGASGGLAAFLARQGFDVFVADLRGKGKSWPRVGRHSRYGLHQMVTEDIPAIIRTLVNKRGAVPQLWVGHGLGGVMLCSYLARYGESLAPVLAIAHFGSRRQSGLMNLTKRLVIDGIWRRMGALSVFLNGYLPAKKLRIGVCDESTQIYRDYMSWTENPHWLDPSDGFDYGEGIRRQLLPPSLYFASAGDTRYGHPEDIRRFIRELGRHDSRLLVFDRQSGGLRNYDHFELLQHPDAERELFPVLAAWFTERLQAAGVLAAALD